VTPQLEIDCKTDAAEHCITRNPGAAIETTEITNIDGAKVAWSEVKNACEIEGLTITEVCTRYKLNTRPFMHARQEGNGKSFRRSASVLRNCRKERPI
jgi:hypothetical protein